ncbi:MAG: RNA-binding S4 domain-containing protein [Hyphomicrobiales bacterium]
MSEDSQRIDKWLWYARFFKTRTAATKFVASGKIRVNKTRATKPGQIVRIGDILTFTLHSRLRIIEILGAGTRRGPAAEARMLYDDLSPPVQPAGASAAGGSRASPASREAGSGRPTKKERRDLERILPAWDGSDENKSR